MPSPPPSSPPPAGPQGFEQRLDQAQALVRAGQGAEALPMLQRLAQQQPKNLGVLTLLMMAHNQTGKPDQAEFYARQVVALLPRHPDAHANLAAMLASSAKPAKLAEAERVYRHALTLDPANLTSRLGLANLLASQHRTSEVDALCTQTASLGLFHPQLSVTHASALQSMLEGPRAEGLLLETLRADPANVQAHVLLCSISQQLAHVDASTLFARHRAAGGAIMAQVAPAFGDHLARLSAPRQGPLVVGILSPDLRRHSVASFIEPVFRHLDPARFTLRAYHTNAYEDDVSAHLRSLLPKGHWTNLAGQSDHAVARAIHADKIDILIDLAGYTSGQRLAVLAMAPAPAQATYCGYPDGLGLPTVHARFVDSITDPPAHGPTCVEALVRIDPCFLCYQPPPATDSPAIAPPITHDQPARADSPQRPITFGSFNALRKLSPPLLRVWAALLEQLPGARLVLKASELRDPVVREALPRVLRAHGLAGALDAGRIDILPPAPTTSAHLEAYAQVDVALDTFPYTGTTTTCEALWMGVPVVTLCPPNDQPARHAQRVSASLLTAAGLKELIAPTPEQYIALAKALATDRARLAHLRASLRDQLLRSPLMDQPSFAQRFGDALEQTWRLAQQRAGVPTHGAHP